MRDLAPIVLFVYNRLYHTQQTVAALQGNLLAAESHLFIYSDASKDEKDRDSVLSVRAYIKTITGFRSVSIVERTENHGLASSIIDGVSTIVNQYGKIIVIEDDLVTSPLFLTFMNNALDYYQEDERVMNVNGYVLPGMTDNGNGMFFIRIPSSWGWGTWARSWKFFDRDADKIIGTFDVRQRHQFDFESTFPFFRTIVRNHRGVLKTWAIFWYAAIFQHGGLCVSPVVSLVANIGNDGSGENSAISNLFEVNLAQNLDVTFSEDVAETVAIYQAYQNFYRYSHTGILTRCYMVALRLWRKFLLLF